tara:strand:+ start:2184 stop:3155 length:972 start_codon:yes stop_codon:yes gene_type:complete
MINKSNNLFLLLRKPFKKKIINFHKELTDDPEKVSKIIKEKICQNKPLFIGRMGSAELNIIENYLGITKYKKSIKNFILDRQPEWFWHPKKVREFNHIAGFFPINEKLIEKYCELTLKDYSLSDILGFTKTTFQIAKKYSKYLNHSEKILCRQHNFEPYYANNPWSEILKNKKVLVINPFEDAIKSQFEKKDKLFLNKKILPNFELKTIKSIVSLAGEKTKFKDWFEALDHMKNQINKTDFDIALIGCGAYGFNLAAHCKKIGKIGIHLGGVLQILFGIYGNRYLNPNQSNGIYLKLKNQHWVRPNIKDRPIKYKEVEGGSYW